MKVKGYMYPQMKKPVIKLYLKLGTEVGDRNIRKMHISMPTGFFIWGYMYPFTFIFV
jgi:hypothetical protein